MLFSATKFFYACNNFCVDFYERKCSTSLKIDFFISLRLGAQSVTLLSTLRDPTQLRQSQCVIEPKKVSYAAKKVRLGFRGFHTCFGEVDLTHCDVRKQKTQILIAHQKEGIDKTQKSTARV